MDPLTHVFLPLTVVYVLYPHLFVHRRVLLLSALGLLSDFDKFLGVPGALHSLLTLLPICLCFVAVEKRLRGTLSYSVLVTAVILSHPLIDVIDGGPVPLLAPITYTGVGLQYPMEVTFGEGALGIVLSGSLVTLAADAPKQGFNTYGVINAFGVTSALLFGVLYLTLERRSRRARVDGE